MSITSSVPDPWSGIAFTAVGQRCFYCGEPLADPALHWMGEGGHLLLHPSCFVRLATRLFRDLHEIEKPSYYRQRIAAVARIETSFPKADGG